VLYRNSFVMYDRETRSLWVHTTGQAVKGELRGEQLEFLPSEVVPWNVWSERHPQSLVLDRGGEDTDFMGTFGLPDRAEAFGYSVGSGTRATLYAYEYVVESGLVEHGDHLVVHVAEEDAVRAFARAGKSYHLDAAGQLSDGAGGLWDPRSGESRAGGTADLLRLPATPWLIDRWRGFYGAGEVVGAAGD